MGLAGKGCWRIKLLKSAESMLTSIKYMGRKIAGFE